MCRHRLFHNSGSSHLSKSLINWDISRYGQYCSVQAYTSNWKHNSWSVSTTESYCNNPLPGLLFSCCGYKQIFPYYYFANFQVDTNGYFKFEDSPGYCCPEDRMDSDYLIFPYWDDTNTDNPYEQGQVSYEVHTTDTSAAVLSQVSKFLEEVQEVEFTGLWMVLAQWSDVPSQQLLELLLDTGSIVSP